MCTITKGIIYPGKDLICFKVMFQKPDGTLVSPYHRENWTVGETHRTYATSPETMKMLVGTMMFGGCFHTYQYVKDAVEIKGHIEFNATVLAPNVHTDVVVVCKCIVPKESLFVYEGEEPTWTGRRAPCYASEMLRIDEVIHDAKFATL